MNIQKQGRTTPTGMPGEADLALIHRQTRRALTADEVYTFTVTLCDNEVDRDGERFTTACLKALRPMFVGKTGIFDHSGRAEDQVMRIYETYIEEKGDYAALRAKVYLPRSEENAALIREIDAGIKKEVSISCAVKRVRCSVCGKAMSRCEHKKGVSYGGKVCHAVLEQPTDAYEFSFVAVPAQPAAGVLKRRKQAAGRQDLAELERLAEDGRAFRAELLEKTIRAGVTAVPEMTKELLAAMCGSLETAQLRQVHDMLRERAAKSLPVGSQLVAKEAGGRSLGNEGFKL